MVPRICPSCSHQSPGSFKFCGNCGHQLRDAPRDDRREVTVLFADVIGFTSLCERLDAEEVHEVMNACFTGLGRVIQEEEGCVDRYLGDALLALFGAPTGHEDDPARGCRAALAMQTFLESFSRENKRRVRAPLQMRIGIHCGLVVAGGVGSDARMVYGARGDTMNTAARLQAAAKPGGVIISGEVARRTRRLFALGSVRYLSVKGKERDVEAYDLFGKTIENRLHDRDTLSGPVVGREAELFKLETHLKGAQPWIEIRGEMGIGKTRLLEEWANRNKRMRLLSIVATPGSRRQPFGLVRQLLYAAIQEVTGQESRPESIASFAEALKEFGQNLSPYLDALWHLAAPRHLLVPPPDPDPLTLRRTTEQGIATLLKELVHRSPEVVLFLDSYQLADDSSAEFLESLSIPGKEGPLPIVVATRDEGRPVQRSQAIITLRQLKEETAAEILENLLQGTKIPETVRRNVLKRADGNPLYVEELVRSLIDQGLLTLTEERFHWSGDSEEIPLSLPASIRAAMVCRLDRLARAERDLLSQCAVQGTEFNLLVTEEIRQARGDMDPTTLSLLHRLELQNLVKRVRSGGWAFCQPLMQETCYETLLLRTRQTWHAETADALCRLSGGPELVAPEVLAHHYEGAKEWVQAARANIQAGDRAREFFLNDEALYRYHHAIEGIDRVEEPEQIDAAVHAAMLAHRGAARVLLRMGDYTRGEYHAKKMGVHSSAPHDQAEANRLEAVGYWHRGQSEVAERLLLSALELAQDSSEGEEMVATVCCDLAELYHREDRTFQALEYLGRCRRVPGSLLSSISIQVDMLEGKIAHTEGRFVDAAALYLRAYQVAEKEGGLSERARASNSRGNVARDQGDYEGAKGYYQRALETWERTGDAECIAGAHNNLGNLMMSQGYFAEAREHHKHAIAAFRTMGNVHGISLAQANLATLAMEEGDASMAVATAEAALETLGESGNALLQGLVLVVMGEAFLESLKVRAAEETFHRVLRTHEEVGNPLAVAGAKRGLGRVALLKEKPREALLLLNKALEAFEQLSRAQEVARTRIHKARALRQCREYEQAVVELQKAHEAFVNMHAERDMQRVDQLLADLLKECDFT